MTFDISAFNSSFVDSAYSTNEIPAYASTTLSGLAASVSTNAELITNETVIVTTSISAAASKLDFESQSEEVLIQLESRISEYHEISELLAANTWQVFTNNAIWKSAKKLSAKKLFEKFSIHYFTSDISSSISSIDVFSNPSSSNKQLQKREWTHLEKSLAAVSAFSAIVFGNTFLGCFFAPGTILISYGISILQCFSGIGLSSAMFIITWVMFVATLQYSYELFNFFSATESMTKRGEEEKEEEFKYKWDQVLSKSDIYFNRIFGSLFTISRTNKEIDIDHKNIYGKVYEFEVVFSDNLKRCDLFHDIKFGMKIDALGIISFNTLFIPHNSKVSFDEDIARSPYRNVFESSQLENTNTVDSKRLIPHGSALKIIASFNPSEVIAHSKDFSFTRVSTFFIKKTIKIAFGAATDITRYGYKFSPMKHVVKFGDAINEFHSSINADMEVTSHLDLF